MKRIEALKYYSIGKSYDVESAQEKIEALREKHPDREYTFLINVRSGYNRVMIAQVKKVTVDWPDREEAGLPLDPPCPPLDASQQEYDAWYHHVQFVNHLKSSVYGPLKKALFGKLNG